MLRTRLILIIVSALLIAGLFMLPKAVVENENELVTKSTDSVSKTDPHDAAPEALLRQISQLRNTYRETSESQKKAIFADSLASLFTKAGKFDSAGWYAEQAAKFCNN